MSTARTRFSTGYETEVSEKTPREAANDLDPSVFDQD
jgi:hypothetical protein